MVIRRRVLLKLPVFALASLPALRLAIALLDGALRADPYPTVIGETGFWSMRLLILGLAITPLRALTGWGALLGLRRMIGPFAAFYAALHLAAWAKDYDFDGSFLAREIVLRPFLGVGFVGALLLAPLAATSTKAAARRLGGVAWQRLHMLAYPIALAAYAHFLLAGRLRSPELMLEGSALVLVFGWHIVAAGRQLWPLAFGLPGDRVHRAESGILLEPIAGDIDTWFADLDRFADVPFMEDGRRQPPMPDAEDLFQ